MHTYVRYERAMIRCFYPGSLCTNHDNDDNNMPALYCFFVLAGSVRFEVRSNIGYYNEMLAFILNSGFENLNCRLTYWASS